MQFDNQGWLDVAREIDYTRKSESREGYVIKYIILHGTAGGSSAQNIGNYFATSDVQASAHFVIGVDGAIVQGVPCSLAAWANGPITGIPANLGFRVAGDGVHRDPWWDPNINPNWVSVSIEHCKPHDDNSDQLTPVQRESSFQLVKAICETYGVPKRFADANGGITGHFSMDPENRSRCPGPYDWQGLFNYLNGNEEDETVTIDLTNGVVKSHFTGDNNIWKCTDNGFLVGHAILDFYRKFGGDALCGLTYLGLPKGNEKSVLGKPGVVEQAFERASVRYDPGHILDFPPGSSSVYVIHVEQDARFVEQKAEIAVLQAQIAAMQPDALAAENTALKAKITQAVKDLS